jgi:hypothetical protein
MRAVMPGGAAVSIGWLWAACIVPAFAQAVPPQTQTPDRPQAASQNQAAQEFAPQEFLAAKLARWRQRLGLEDWRISVVMAHRADLPPKTMGGIRWDKPTKSAVIWVLDPSEYRLPFREMLDDMELTIVHELVHLDLTSLPRGQASRGSEERAVNSISRAMLDLDRKNP